MILFVTLVHFVVAALLITFVLIQDSKGGGVFGMGSGGGSNQVFSATGAANFLVKATRALAIMFATTCIALTYLTSKKADSVVDDYLPAATAPAAAGAAPSATEAAQAPAAPAANTATDKSADGK